MNTGWTLRRAAALASIAAAAACGGDTGSITGPPPPPVDTTKTSYLGFDVSGYPGDAAMAAWKYPSSPYYWAGYYLPAPCHRTDTSWSGKYATLHAMGWGVLAIYVGQQDWSQIPADIAVAERAQPSELLAPMRDYSTLFTTCSASLLSVDQGRAEALDAIAKLEGDGFPTRSIVYLDVEYVSTVSPALLDYIRGWLTGILADGTYRPGIYMAKSNSATIHDAAHATAAQYAAPDPAFWIASSVGFDTTRNPTDVGLSYASVWQGAFDVSRSYDGVALKIDEDVATTRSPSAP
ncbi:MAG TPA: glycoside hydrolase domain-containing protein [Gemmatimonadaceae bacterium]|nr:glycoside hydrolase domain-containing protein [Gemmatimonadaceae bacterium]